MTIYQVLQNTGLPCVFSHFKDKKTAPKKPPYLVYIGNGQNVDPADNDYYYKQNLYQVQYYFTEKDEAKEAEIEDALLDNGYHYTKSEDVFIEGEGVFVIYYNV